MRRGWRVARLASVAALLLGACSGDNPDPSPAIGHSFPDSAALSTVEWHPESGNLWVWFGARLGRGRPVPGALPLLRRPKGRLRRAGRSALAGALLPRAHCRAVRHRPVRGRHHRRGGGGAGTSLVLDVRAVTGASIYPARSVSPHMLVSRTRLQEPTRAATSLRFRPTLRMADTTMIVWRWGRLEIVLHGPIWAQPRFAT